MVKYILKKSLKIILPILAIIIIFFTTNIIKNRQETKSAKDIETIQEGIYSNEQKLNKNTEENQIEVTRESETTNENWKIEIPEISLIASISEGTNEETLNKYVGHFSSTPKEKGNVGLAAHNKGYPVNFFADLKNLEGGEEIIYTYEGFTKTYVVTQNIKISDIDWSYLENSNENKITLITCIENEPAYRRCVQATEKEEN